MHCTTITGRPCCSCRRARARLDGRKQPLITRRPCCSCRRVRARLDGRRQPLVGHDKAPLTREAPGLLVYHLSMPEASIA